MKLAHVPGVHSPRMGRPLRRKKSSGASRPSMVKTTSFGSVSTAPSAVRRLAVAASRRVTAEPSRSCTEPVGVRRCISPMSAVLARSLVGWRISTGVSGLAARAWSFSMLPGLGRANSFFR